MANCLSTHEGNYNQYDTRVDAETERKMRTVLYILNFFLHYDQKIFTSWLHATLHHMMTSQSIAHSILGAGGKTYAQQIGQTKSTTEQTALRVFLSWPQVCHGVTKPI